MHSRCCSTVSRRLAWSAQGVHRALLPGGRFIADCGGAGNVLSVQRLAKLSRPIKRNCSCRFFAKDHRTWPSLRQVRVAFAAVLAQHGIDHREGNPWNFSSAAAAQRRLEAAGFEIRSCELVPRPTPMPTDISGWLDTFAASYFSVVPAELRAKVRAVQCGDEGCQKFEAAAPDDDGHLSCLAARILGDAMQVMCNLVRRCGSRFLMHWKRTWMWMAHVSLTT